MLYQDQNISLIQYAGRDCGMKLETQLLQAVTVTTCLICFHKYKSTRPLVAVINSVGKWFRLVKINYI